MKSMYLNFTDREMAKLKKLKKAYFEEFPHMKKHKPGKKTSWERFLLASADALGTYLT